MPASPILPPDDNPVSFPSMPTLHTGDPNALGRIDHYDLLRKLGGGGFGVVYLAKDTNSGVEVALKTLHPLLKTNAEEMDALREKFALVSRLTHTNIAKALVLHPVRDLNIWDETARREMRLSSGDSVMVMDYAPGVTLSRWRRQFPDGVVPLDLALEIARQLASALDYAHGERIVHRDIKPGNIMVETLRADEPRGASDHEVEKQDTSKDGGASRPGEQQLFTLHSSPFTPKLRVRLLDFGLAAEIRSSMSRVSTEQGDTSGTRPYMAPEQWLGRKQDGRTDQYALACVLYELLSGAPPFAGVFESGDPVMMERAVMWHAPESVPGLPRAANAAFLRALAKDPVMRFPSCGAFVEALSRGVRGGRVAGTTRPSMRWFAAAAAVAVAVAGALWYTRSRGEIPHAESAETSAQHKSYAEFAESAETAELGGASRHGEPPREEETHAESAGGSESGGESRSGEPQSEAARVADLAREEAELQLAAERKAREEAERKLAEEAELKLAEERKAQEIAEAARKAGEEAERQLAAERKAREEAERKLAEELKAREEVARQIEEARRAEETRKAEAERKARQEAERKTASVVRAGDRKEVKIGGVTVVLRWCPPDSFTMGSPSGEHGRYDNETQHRMTLTKGFWMGETEVTQGLWQEVMRDNHKSYNDRGGSYPVEQVSWNDCMQFVGKLNERSDVKACGLRFALPTEAQWEYACRAGTTDPYAGTGRLDDMGWYSSNSDGATHPVARKLANAWGLHDMHGNVWEWCADLYGPYPSGATTDSPGAASGDYRVLRGGSCCNDLRFCRSAGRGRNFPDRRDRYDGLRLVAFQDGRMHP